MAVRPTAAPAFEVSYYRLEVPPSPPIAPTSDETLSLEALHRDLLARRAAEVPASVVVPVEQLPTFRLDAAATEVSPLYFGPVQQTVPRRRALPRRAAETDDSPTGDSPVESSTDQVN